MKNNLQLVKKVSAPIPAELYFGKVIALEQVANQLHYSVQLGDDSVVNALKAESCFLLPAIDDLILLSSEINGESAYILQILNRTANENVVDLGQEVSLRAHNLKLEAQKTINVEAPEVNLTGLTGTAKFSHSKLLSNWSEVRTGKSLFIAESAEKIINTVTEKIVNVFKTIEGIEFTKANRIRTMVTGRLFYKARHVTLNAEEEVGIDGKKINMG